MTFYEFTSFLRSEIKKSGKTQNEIAVALKVSPQRLNNAISFSKKDPYLVMKIRLAEYFGYHVRVDKTISFVTKVK